MTVQIHILKGCSPSPLANYLKALGVLRLVAEQADPDVRGHWVGESFCLLTKLERGELERFFLVDYQPTPLVAPWNKGSGFYAKKDDNLDPIEKSKARRFEPFQAGIKAARKLLNDISEADSVIRAIKAATKTGKSFQNEDQQRLLQQDPLYLSVLEKLEQARQALGGQVFDVLGRLEFEGKSLRELLIEAIRFGERPEVQNYLSTVLDAALDRGHLQSLLDDHALAHTAMDASRVQRIRADMERADARRLQPHYIESFFHEAFRRLGGSAKQRESGRYEISHVPAPVRNRDRLIGLREPVMPRYERITFEKALVAPQGQVPAAFVCPGHPLLEAVISLIREQYEQIMRQGAILVDDTDAGDALSAIFLLEHTVQDGRVTSAGKPHVISQRLQFAAIDKAGNTVNAGLAPHLNLRPATPEEVASVRNLLDESWLTTDLEKAAIRFATVELAQGHVAEVKARRLPEIEKVEQEVRARLKKEINYWDSRAFELKEEERAGKKTRVNWQNAQRRAEELADRQKRRMDQLEQERFISSQPPRVRGGMVVVPRGLLEARQAPSVPDRFAEDPAARRAIELAAMEAVMAAERALGNEPADVSAQKIGYDIASHDPRSGHLRFIEVKGRIDGADSVMVTRQEVITSLHEPEKFILAIVQVAAGSAHTPRYVRGPLVEREPSFLETAIQFDLRRLLERAQEPA